MAYKPIFKVSGEDVDRLLDEKLAQKAKEIEEKNRTDTQTFLEQRLKEERAKEEQRLKDEYERKTRIEQENKAKDEQAAKLREEIEKKLREDLEKEKRSKEEEKKAEQTKAQTTQASPETSSKIAKMIEDIKRKREEDTARSHQVQHHDGVPSHDTYTGEKAPPGGVAVGGISVLNPKEVDPGIDCPTCHSHIHSLKPDGMTVKCEGPNCGKEFVIVDKDSDYKCVDCNVPIKKPVEGKTVEACPFCGGKRAVKFDWSKLWKVQKGTKTVK